MLHRQMNTRVHNKFHYTDFWFTPLTPLKWRTTPLTPLKWRTIPEINFEKVKFFYAHNTLPYFIYAL